MSSSAPLSEYLVISRGQWDSDKTSEEIQTAIDAFYVWYERMLDEGRMKAGQRLAVEGRRVSRGGITDGPFSEAKEVIGGYWFIMAASLDEAAALAAENPCMTCGLTYDVRPTEVARASACAVTSETPGRAA
ncbi:MAG: YciI family protein [Pseudomonadota bacterium]